MVSFEDIENQNKYSTIRNFQACFDKTNCNQYGFKVYVYPQSTDSRSALRYFDQRIWPMSSIYAKILASIKQSEFYTANFSQACLFVLSFDTLDRDPLSANYVKNLDRAIQRLPKLAWNNGIFVH